MLIYWSLPMILFLGIVTSYEDIKFGKIRNKWILLAIFYALLTYFILFLIKIYELNLLNIAINSLLALILGFLMWSFNLWRAGDAKLFFAFVILMPFALQDFFSFIQLLGFVFIPIFVFLAFYLLIKTSFKEKLFYFKSGFNKKVIINYALFIFGVPWIINLALNYIGIKNNLLIFLIIVVLVYYIIENVLEIKFFYIGLLLLIARLYLDKSIYSIDFAIRFFISLVVFLMLILIISISAKHLTKELKFSELKQGMLPAENIFKHKGKYYKRPLRTSSMRFARKKFIGKRLLSFECLTKQEIDRLKSLQKDIPFKTLRVQSTLPFAPFIFLGTLLTIFAEFLKLHFF